MDKFKDNPNVKFLFVNTYERVSADQWKSTVNTFVKQRGFTTFPVILDIGGEVARVDIADGGDKGRPEQGQFKFAGWNRSRQCGLHGITLHKDMERE